MSALARVNDKATNFAYGWGVRWRWNGPAVRAEFWRFDTDLIGDLEPASLGVRLCAACTQMKMWWAKPSIGGDWGLSTVSASWRISSIIGHIESSRKNSAPNQDPLP